ncbi:hypothetical protein UFOVP833_19 [uncultured Caudovirales phage]|uniref:Uncharacterized protein n=1 Tax=uncultured Caudovirales phage TaxID=2100421 RepID=A0A6J5SRG2_9CAUD|nr:hypothetical protein UFOVP833_19 [uncultured Caudovirales phage]CAB4218063.1 hypothetical protein UFOVP1603_6 [uncultured Caudovirales phage]
MTEREELQAALETWRRMTKSVHFQTIFDAAEKHLATLPKVREVEMWCVRYAVHLNGDWVPDVTGHASEVEAKAAAALMAKDYCFSHISVTGPHKQLVPE